MFKRFILICLIPLVCFLTACTDKEVTGNQIVTDAPNETEDIMYEEGVLIDLYAYDATEDQQYISLYELAPEEIITAEVVVNAYQQQIMEGIYGTSVAINGIKQNNNKLYIDFNKEDVQSLTLDTGSEGSYFGNLAASIAANLPNITEIYYSMDGEDFIIGHLWFDKDGPFWYAHDIPSEE